MTITCRVYRDGVLEEGIELSQTDLHEVRRAGERVWIDAVDPSEEELRTLQRTLDLHELSVEDSARWGQRSKIESYPGYVFLVVHAMRLSDDDELVDSELHLFVGEGFYLVTIRREPLFDLPRAESRLGTGTPSDLHGGIGYHLYAVLDEIVDGYLDTVDRLEDLADDIEDHVFADDGGDDLQERIFRLKRTTVRFRRAAAPLREVIDLVSDRGDIVTASLLPYYRDVLDHVIRTLELVDNIRELLSSALETRLAQASNRLNIVMKQLSAWAAIILIPTLIAGVYGMNFTHMPELRWRFGYPFALGLMGVAALLLYRVFHKRDWL